MKLAVYIKNSALKENPKWISLKKALVERGDELYEISTGDDFQPGTKLLLSVGGDGTFLSAAKRVSDKAIPVLGVNLGRLGFLSEYRPEDVLEALVKGDWSVEDRHLLKVSGAPEGVYPYVLNEVSIRRVGPSILGIRVTIDGEPLPVYWADGILVSTSSGSTAYNLSAGGPIAMPGAKVLMITPVAPHNLNVRPLVVPDTAKITLETISRDAAVQTGLDNRNVVSEGGVKIDVSMAQFSLERVRLGRRNFVGALTDKLFWGEDIRNGK